MRNDLVSIIIPAYNAEKHIERAVMSAVQQSYSDIEIIVINDGSKDSTEEILKRLAEENKQVSYYTQKNMGVSVARNVGLEHIKGAFYMFVDADDALIENAVELMHKSIEENNADIVVADFNIIDLSKNQVQRMHATKENKNYLPQEAISLAIEDNPITYSSCGKLYRSQKLQNIRFPEGMRAHEDSYYVFQCLMCDVRITILNIPLYEIYVTHGSASRSEFGDKYKDILSLAEKKERIIQEKYPEQKDKAKTVMVKANMSVLYNLCVNSKKLNFRLINQCVKAVRSDNVYFIPATEFDKKFFWVITHNLVYLYRAYVQTRFYLKKLIKTEK